MCEYSKGKSLNVKVTCVCEWRMKEMVVETFKGEVRCLWMLSVSCVIYHQDRYRYGVLASQPHYTFAFLFKHKHTLLYTLTQTLSPSIFHLIALAFHCFFLTLSILTLRWVGLHTHTHTHTHKDTHKQTYISIKPWLSMMNVVTF